MGESDNQEIREPADPGSPQKSDKPDVSGTETAKAKKNASSAGSSARRFGMAGFLFNVCLLAAIGFLGFLEYREDGLREELLAGQNDLTAGRISDQAAISGLQNMLATVQAQLMDASARLDEQRQLLDQFNEELINTRLSINSANAGVNQQWLLAEAESLIRLARQELVVARDVRSAIALFVASDDILKRVNDTAVFSIRDALARDLAALRALPDIDVQGIFLRLGAVAERAGDIPVISGEERSALDAAEVTFPAPQPATESGWLASALDRIGDFIIVRRLDAPVQPLLTDEQAYFIRQNIVFLLEQAKLALLREQPEIYRNNIERAMVEINGFLVEGPERQGVLEALRELHDVPVTIQIPSLANSMGAFRQVLANLNSSADEEGRD